MSWFTSSHSVYSHTLKMKVPLKHWYISAELHGITVQKTDLNTAVRTSDLSYRVLCFAKSTWWLFLFLSPFPQALSCFKTRETKHKVLGCKNLLTEQTNCKFRSLLRVVWLAEIPTHLLDLMMIELLSLLHQANIILVFQCWRPFASDFWLSSCLWHHPDTLE